MSWQGASASSFTAYTSSPLCKQRLQCSSSSFGPSSRSKGIKMLLRICKASLLLAYLLPVHALNFKADFTEEIQPFHIDVNKELLQLTKFKATITRYAEDIEQEDWVDGPPQINATTLAQYWSKEYDWRKVEADINAKLQQFITTVETGPNSNYTGPIPIHFVHHRSPRPDAIPFIFVHGWPGSFLEVEPIINALTHPPSNDIPAFHVVAPSIPGYGFSPNPTKPGFGSRQAAATFNALMLKLGYAKYVFQGGDAGDFINRFAAIDFPDNVVSGLSNFWVVPPTEADQERYRNKQTTDDETFVIERYNSFLESGWAYGQIQLTRPLKLAYAMTDSPVGLAMWIYDALYTAVGDQSVWTLERVVTWTMMHWVNGPYGAFGLYKNHARDGIISTKGFLENAFPYVPQPIAISQFPFDLHYRTPLDWAQRSGNVVRRTVHERGGHFAALDATDLLVEDIRGFFGDGEVSGTSVFAGNAGTGGEEGHDEL